MYNRNIYILISFYPIYKMGKISEELSLEQKIMLKIALQDYENKMIEFCKPKYEDERYWNKRLMEFQKVKRTLALVGAI